MEYKCELCSYFSRKKHNYFKHLKTQKHQKNTEKKEITGVEHKKVATSLIKCLQKTPKCLQMPPKNSEILEKKKIENKKIENEKFYKNLGNKKRTNFICKFCKKNFTRKDNMLKHMRNMVCKKKKTEEIFENLKNEIKEELKNKLEIKEFENFENNKIINSNQITNFNNFNNINSNNKVIININNFGDENLNMLNENYLKNNFLKMPFTAIPKMIENIHFNNKYPENQNIRLLNKKDNKVQILENNKWKYVSKEDTLRNLIEDKNIKMQDIYHKNLNKLSDRYKERFEKFREKFDNDDEDLWRDILMDTELVFWNNM